MIIASNYIYHISQISFNVGIIIDLIDRIYLCIFIYDQCDCIGIKLSRLCSNNYEIKLYISVVDDKIMNSNICVFVFVFSLVSIYYDNSKYNYVMHVLNANWLKE
jgi:hypothetical protein